MSDLEHVYFVMLAGGGGTRLWPKSRNKTPKQFLKLVSKETMLQAAASRVSGLVGWDKVIVVTNKQYIDEVRAELPEVPEKNIIAEPAKKDTALAMLTGTLYAQSLDPEAIIANQASDHVVVDQQEFLKVMKAALKVAQDEQHLVTVGITPTFPSSGFGYIKIGADSHKRDGVSVFKVDSFTEKPNVATARAFISTGRYFWNANMYVWSAKTLVAAFKEHHDGLFQKTKPLHTAKPAEFHKLLDDVYEGADTISIDYAISEKAKNLVLIPGDFGWNDVGDWKVVYDLGTKDLAGNVITSEGEQANTLAIESRNNLIHADHRLVAVLGVNDMIVIDTPEILLIIPKERSQDVKKIVERLKEEKQEKYL